MSDSVTPKDCSMPGFPVLHYFPEFAQTCPLSWWCHPTISSSVVPFSSCFQSSPASGFSPMSWLFTSGGQSIGASASASVLPMTDYSGLISFRIDWVWSPGCFQFFLVWCLNFSIWYLKIFSLNVEQYSTIKVWLIDNTEAIINITG